MPRHLARVCALIAILGIFALSLPDEAAARAGGGRSMGSRGTRSYSSPSRPSSPPAQSAAPQAQPRPAPMASPLTQPSPMGGFMRAMAGGIVGGMLGALLFRGLGFAGTPGAEAGWGIGLMDILLLGGAAYLIYAMIRRKREQAAPAAAYAGGGTDGPAPGAAYATTVAEAPTSGAADLARGIGHIRQMDPGFDQAAFGEWCADTFFRIQAAWMRRDLEALRPLLTEEMLGAFRQEIQAARAKGQVNRLENITVRSTTVTEIWQEQGQDYATVRLLANLLDYTVEESSGRVVAGSDREPVKFEEYWTWVRPVGPNPWRLAAIHQAE